MIKNFLISFKNLIYITETFKKNTNIVFFSEGRNHWNFIKPFINALQKQINSNNIKYLTQDCDDNAFVEINKNIEVLYIGSGRVRDYIISNINASILFTTSPDINQFQVKKSKFCLSYCYIQHSLNSLHMAYNELAFDIYDKFFICGDHHKREIRKIIKKYNWPEKELYESIYSPLLDLKKITKNKKITKKTILIAPTWGHNSIIESRKIFEILDLLLPKKFFIYLRPHPETSKHYKNLLLEISNKYIKYKHFFLEESISNYDSLIKSDFLITDWSGIAFDYALGLKKQILFINTTPKIKNKNYGLISEVPIEIRCRNKFGIQVSDIKNLLSKINKIKNRNKINNTFEHFYDISPEDTIKKLIEKNSFLKEK